MPTPRAVLPALLALALALPGRAAAGDLVGPETCKACHPGAYAARYVMRDAELARALGLVVGGERACLGCHTETTPGLRRFDYQQKVKLIAHPDRPGGSAAAAAQPPPQPRTR